MLVFKISIIGFATYGAGNAACGVSVTENSEFSDYTPFLEH